jgi:hypothetical protein
MGASQGANQLASQPRVYAPRYSRMRGFPGALGAGADAEGADVSGTVAVAGAGAGVSAGGADRWQAPTVMQNTKARNGRCM